MANKLFSEVHPSFDVEGALLVFMASEKVQVYPCGRRRTQLIDGGTPYDPEARLNTEANNRKHSGVNGYTQNFIKWDSDAGIVSIIIGGYLFTIKLDYATYPIALFGNNIIEAIKSYLGKEPNSYANIYANILIEEVPLYSSEDLNYTTGILREQSRDTQAQVDTALDRQSTDPDNPFYFAGLSFSTCSLAESAAAKRGNNTDVITTAANKYDIYNSKGMLHQQIISLCILEKPEGANDWVIHQPALLPKIEHGVTSDSIKVGTVYADNVLMQIPAEGGSTRNVTIPSIELVEQDTSDVFRLTISSVTTTPPPAPSDLN